MSAAVRLAVGLSNSARTRPVADGRAPIDGVDAEVTLMGVQALFNQQLTQHTFDVCEFPLATYLRLLDQPDPRYLAVPVFPSRHFRFSCVFVPEGSGARTPADLAGARIGVPVFDMAAAVWLRGIFHDRYALDRFSPTYVTAGPEGPRRGEEHPQVYPPGFRVERRDDAGLAQLLAAGEIDALVTARAPSTWPDGGVRRLFDDAPAAEQAYFNATGIFPAMHVLAVQRRLAEQHPHLPGALYRAFAAAQELARADLFESAALDSILPWQLDELLRTEAVLGRDYWSAGLRANRTMLQQISRYCHDDGLTSRPFAPHELFAGPGQDEVLTT